ncbi:MAG: hypothetical protein WAS21_01555 [Geminicoccaceae bacterium]
MLSSCRQPSLDLDEALMCEAPLGSCHSQISALQSQPLWMATPVDQGDHDPTSNMTVVSSGNDADAAPENKIESTGEKVRTAGGFQRRI